MTESPLKITIKVKDEASGVMKKAIRGSLRHRIKMSYRRWHCDHFDHPFRLVSRVPSKLDPFTPIQDEYWCGYCQRKFEMAVTHRNCKCSVLPIVRDDD